MKKSVAKKTAKPKKSIVKKSAKPKKSAVKKSVMKVEKKEKKSCSRQTGKKYSERPSPPFPANECCDREMVGNDGAMYVSRADKNGRCSWKKVN